MSDDERLTALFRAAASDADAPPPRFGHEDVVAASRRITARRRSAAVAAGVVVLLGGVGTAVALPRSTEDATAAAPMSAPGAAEDSAGSAESGGAGSGDAAREAPAPAAAPGAPGPLSASPPPLGPGSTECADRQDPALRELLVQALPEAAAGTPAATTDVCLPGAERYLALEVADGTASGVLSISYLPPGTMPSLVPGALSAPTASGGTVVVGSRSEDEAVAAAPYADRLPDVLAHLAPRL